MKKTMILSGLTLVAALALPSAPTSSLRAAVDDDQPSAVLQSDEAEDEPATEAADDEEETPAKTSDSEEKEPTTCTGRVLVTLKKPIALTHEPVRFESVFEKAKDPAAPDAQEAPARPKAGGAAKETTELVGRELADTRVLAGNGKYMLEDEFGEIRIIPQSNVESVEPAPDVSVAELRDKYEENLRDEFGAEFQVKSSKHFIFVSNASEGYVDWCGRLFERLEEGFRLYARKSGIKLVDRGEPLVVIVFARQEEFVRYASVETGSPDKLAAYYNMQTNRVALYDLSYSGGSVSASSSKRRRPRLAETREILSRPNAAFNVATIVHEATHQIAFNRGVFLRTGPVALWSAEGLSLVFETPNGLATQNGWSYRGSFPKNERMLELFRANIDSMEDPFRTIVAQDDFYKNLEGSYAASWALFYYLNKKKPVELANYLQHIAAKSPCTVYPAQERIADFEKFFGSDWDKNTAAVIRYIKRL